MEERALFEKSMGQLISLAHFIISTLYWFLKDTTF